MTSPPFASNDVFIFSVSGTSTQNFQLRGGVYLIALAAASWGTVTLNVLAADAVTYVPFQTWSANAGATLTLVSGSYQLDYATLGAATLSLAQQPPSPDWRLESLTQPLPISSSGSVTTITTLPGTTELDLVGGAGGAWVFSENGTTTTGSAGVGTGNASNGTTGDLALYTGFSTNAASGQIGLSTGEATGGDSGVIVLVTGAAPSTGNTGLFAMQTGNAAGGNSGDIQLVVGTASGTRGNVILDAPLITSPAGTGLIIQSDLRFNVGTNDRTGATNSGNAAIYSGGTETGTSGQILVFSGDSSGGATNHVLIASGNAGGGNSGDVELQTGTATGTRGNIILDAPAVLAPLGDVFYIASAPGTGGNESTGAMALESGGPSGTGDSGNATFGTSDAVGGAAGGVLFYAGSSGKVDTDGGSIVMTSGAATNGNADGGHFLLQTAAGHGSGVRGSITLDALRVLILNLPTSASGLATGTLWNSTGTLKVA